VEGEALCTPKSARRRALWKRGAKTAGALWQCPYRRRARAIKETMIRGLTTDSLSLRKRGGGHSGQLGSKGEEIRGSGEESKNPLIIGGGDASGTARNKNVLCIRGRKKPGEMVGATTCPRGCLRILGAQDYL